MKPGSIRRGHVGRRLALCAGLAACLVLGLQGAALASLQVNYTLSNARVNYSADGLGSLAGAGTIQAEVPPGSTVQKAFLYQTFFFNTSPSAAQRTVNFDGTNVTTTQLPHAAPGPCCLLASSRADVTTQVATKIGGGSGITPFTVQYDNSTSDGVGLVVVYTNPALPIGTVAILDGGAEQSGDTTTFNFASAINKGPGFAAEMTLGSGFSFQSGNAQAHDCGGGQFSIVDVNAQRLTSCAGSYDDGEAGNGALMTVGGVGDSINNPANPNDSNGGSDDELYNIEPFISNGNTQLVINSSNPSGDDILYLSVIRVTAAATVTTEICTDGIDNDGDGLIDQQDPDCRPADGIPPTCVLTNPNGTQNGQKFIEVTVRDQQSGLQSVVVNKSQNANTVVPPFVVGTTDPVVIRSTKIVQTQTSVVQLTVTDVAGNKVVCDPASLVVKRKRGKLVSKKLRLPAAEHKVTISNARRGLKRLDITVNGRTWKVRLKPNQRRTISVASALRPGAGSYTIKLTPRGKVGANAFVLISD